MFAQFYENIVLRNPKSIFAILLIALISFGYYSKDFRLDASSETLLIEGDPDLKYLQEISKKYGSKEFLILTYTPKEGMISNVSINNLLSLKYKIQSLEWVHNVVTLLDIPLLDNSEAPLQERLEKFKTLKDDDVDRDRGFKEILSSPVFRNFVISEDGKTSGIIVYLKKNEILENIDNKTRNWLDLRWPDGDIQNSHPTCLTISMYNGVGVLGRICSLIGERGANITNIDFVDRKPDFYSIIIEMHVKDLKHLSNIMTSIEADTDIAVVTRTREVFDPSSNRSTMILSNN